MRLALFASGGGTNCQAILEAIKREELPAEAALCLSNRPDAGALERAQRFGVPTEVLSPSTFADRKTYVQSLLELLNDYEVGFIALAGYLLKVPSAVVETYHGRMLNIHPALLPAFGGKGMYGMHVHRAVIDYGVRWTGVTVHLVDESYDTGPIVLQEPVQVLEGDTPETLAERVLRVEHRLYPEALRLFAEERVEVRGRKVHILEDASSKPESPPSL